MKKILFIIICLMMCLSMQAEMRVKYNSLFPDICRVNHLSGEMPYMYEENIKTTLDYSEALYMPRMLKYDEFGNKLDKPKIVGSSFNTFLLKHDRDKNWEEKSMVYFCESFNNNTNGVIACIDCENTKYEFVIKVLEVEKGGNIKVNLLLKDAKTSETLCVLECKSTNGDDDDEITLRDQLKKLGDSFGDAVRAIQKFNAKEMRKKN